MAYKKGSDRRQRILFPDCIDEYVEADAPVRLFDAFVDSLKMDELGFMRVSFRGKPIRRARRLGTRRLSRHPDGG